MISFLLQCLTTLGALVSKLAPFFLAYQAGKNKVRNDENEERAKTAHLPDAAIADELRERAKRKNKDKR